jgi:UDP-glucose 4-epimerase
MAPSPRLLVTGAAGFIGSHIAQIGIERGYEVHGVDLFTASAPMTAGVHDHRVVRGREDLTSLLAEIRPQICIHAAGRASVRESVADPAPDFASGPALTFALLDGLRRHAPACQTLFLSSAAVYGNPGVLPISEDAESRAISPYGFHKLQCETLCREFTAVYGMRTAVVRIFSAYGEGLRRQVLWDICCKILREGRLLLMGTGEETRDFLHVRDIAAGLLQIVDRAPMAAEPYNLASGRAISIGDLAKMAISALGVDIEPEFDGLVPSGDPLHWRADISKITALGFAPTIPLTAGLRSYAEWTRHQFITQ